MTISVQKRQGQPREIFRINPVAVGCTLLMLASGAYAQQTAATLETVTVTGIRKGIEDAISAKKNNDSIVEVISAEDIGKLPDSSIAESLSRLPGVAAQRNKSTGKASNVSVRGMPPDFTGTLLNGREQASTGDSRGVEFDLYPAELTSKALVYKTPDGRLVGQGLAATIDLQTVRPLDFGKRMVAVNYKKQRTGIDSGAGEGTGDRYSLAYIDQFADRTIGVAVGFVRFEETGAEQQKRESWGTAEDKYNGATVKVPGGFKADTETNNQKREGFAATLQYKPNKNFNSTLDFFTSKGSSSLKKTGMEGGVGWGSAGGYDPVGTLTNATIANGVATSGTYDNWKAFVRNHLESSDDKLTNIGWNNKVVVSQWTIDADISQSKAVRNSTRYETTAGLPGNAAKLDTITFSGFNGDNNLDVIYKMGLNYADRNVAKLTDVGGWSGGPSSPQAGYVALPRVEDKIDAFRLSGKRDLAFGPITAAEFGVNFSDREKVRTTKEGRLVVKGGDPYGVATVPGSGTMLAGTTGLSVVSFDPTGSLGTIFDLAAKVDGDILNKDWRVKEKVITSYVKGDLDGEFMGLAYHGNIGLQMVNTDQSSTGFNVDRAACTGNTAATCPGKNVSDGSTYIDFLPSLNIGFDLGSDQVLRVAAAKQIARTNMGDQRASLGFGVQVNDGVPMLRGDGGNPKLEPFRASALDVSYEKYFGTKGYVAFAGFYKKLDSYVLNVSQKFDFKPYVGPNTPLPLLGPNMGSTIGALTMPTNGEGGSIKGVELAVNVPFSMVTSWLDGFGASVNYSNTSSSVNLPTSGFSTQDVATKNIPMPGLSKQVTNLVLYYERNGFQVRVADRIRSDFLGEISDFQDTRKLTYIKGESIIDIQMGYEFQTGFMKGLGFTGSISNVTNAEFQTYETDPNIPKNRIKFGKTYFLGMNYKF